MLPIEEELSLAIENGKIDIKNPTQRVKQLQSFGWDKTVS